MQYINPYRLFAIDAEKFTPTDLVELKTNLRTRLAGYSEEELVTHNGTKLTKKTLFELLESLANPSVARLHHKISENAELYNFLEYGHLNYLYHRAAYAEDTALMNFVAPYFAYQFSETLVQALKTSDRDVLKLLAGQSLPKISGDESAYYQATAQYIENTLDSLKKLEEDARLVYMTERELLSHLPDKTVELYNLLPDYFEEARNMIGHQVGVLSEQLWRDFGRRDGAKTLIDQALKLKLNLDLQQRLLQFKKMMTPEWNKVPIIIGIAGGVVALLFLMKWIEQVYFN